MFVMFLAVGDRVDYELMTICTIWKMADPQTTKMKRASM